MSEINRSLIIVKPKQPFFEWARARFDDESQDLTLEELVKDSTAYLIPEIWHDSDEQEFIETYYDILFEEQLEEWSLDQTLWPQNRDLNLFLEWFVVEFHSLVIDLYDEPLRVVEE